jgi:hypothetical protein
MSSIISQEDFPNLSPVLTPSSSVGSRRKTKLTVITKETSVTRHLAEFQSLAHLHAHSFANSQKILNPEKNTGAEFEERPRLPVPQHFRNKTPPTTPNQIHQIPRSEEKKEQKQILKVELSKPKQIRKIKPRTATAEKAEKTEKIEKIEKADKVLPIHLAFDDGGFGFDLGPKLPTFEEYQDYLFWVNQIQTIVLEMDGNLIEKCFLFPSKLSLRQDAQCVEYLYRGGVFLQYIYFNGPTLSLWCPFRSSLSPGSIEWLLELKSELQLWAYWIKIKWFEMIECIDKQERQCLRGGITPFTRDKQLQKLYSNLRNFMRETRNHYTLALDTYKMIREQTMNLRREGIFQWKLET